MNSQRQLFTVFKTNEWVEDDCIVKDCSDGYIFTRSKGVYRCPKCSRAKNTGLLTAKHHLLMFSEGEMVGRKAERERVTKDVEFRLSRGRKMIKDIVAITLNGGNGNGRCKEEEKCTEEAVPW